ncbi:hypothetical protein [Stutzerimonas balearica]|uniref:Uncharacterized protein n=1 Tax=Stutzerimonas balearica DSM 6083 TaxID=1123016 RepID=A0A8D3Y3L9_9GAMM|nr:hypothetical protein [Stutzerimonas balearica]AJE16544.1 hypothetical protein CL52_16405 [Stutzerimonas balearica DSM 6083]SDM80050.1 hypothetical protein SAMN05660875_10964 [Stutzerimonas balearica DSM 6083]
MLLVNTLPPERMTPEQRCAELAGLLAAGLCRMRQPNFAKSANTPQETPFVLGFPVEQSVHSDIDNNPSMEP